MDATIEPSELSADELRQVRWALGGVLTLLSVATVFYLDIPAWTLLGLATAGVGLGLARPAWPARIPRWVHRLAFPVIVAVFLGDLWLSGEVLPAMVRLDLLLLAYRGATYRQRRDDLQIVVLGLFLVVVAGVLTVSLTFAAHLLAFTACALVFLLVITLSEGGRPAASGETAGVPSWAREVRWRRLAGRVRAATDWRVVALGGGLFAGLVALSALLFLAIPRFQLENSLFLERFMSKKARTGFSDTIRFGEVTEIQQDNSVALTVDVSDRSRVPLAPYWRMLVLDEYHDGTFRLSPWWRRAGFGRELGGVALRGARRRSSAEPVTWTFFLEAGVSRHLPLLGDFESVRFREMQRFRFSPPLGLIALRDEPVSMLAYRVENMEAAARWPDRELAARVREVAANPRRAPALMLATGLTADDERQIAAVVAEIAGGEPGRTAEEFVRRASAWLGARHEYSLQPAIPAGAGDPLVRWMTSREGGHCELFAGSLVLLARVAGLPARVVTGFRGGSWNGYSNNFTIRNSDAHAWCEIFDVSAGEWLRADPTPGGSAAAAEETVGEAAIARRLDRSWTARLDSLRVFWYRRIVSFDQQTQLETMQAVKTATENSGKQLRETLTRWVAAAKAWLAAPWNGGRAAKWLAIGVALVTAVRLAWRLRHWIGEVRLVGRGDAVRREAGRWLARLRSAPTPVDGAERVARDAVVVDLQRLRFGARESWGEVAGIFRRARAVLAAAKRRRVLSK